MTDGNEKTKVTRHWATMLLGLIVAAIFLTVIFSYQVEDRETALVITLDKVSSDPVGPGLHFRWPYPIQKIEKFDNRYRVFDGNVGRLEETLTKDGHNVIVGIYAIYKISDPVVFFKKLVDVTNAEDTLNAWMRSVKTETFGRYDFKQLVNVNPKEVKLSEMEGMMLDKLRATAADYGIEVKSVGVKAINIPETITESVFTRMKNERAKEAATFRARGKREAEKIKTEADTKSRKVLAEAEAEAQIIRSKGDAEAAKYYAVFKENPELAIFLRKLESLRRVMQDKTTLILDTNSAPFDILKMNSDSLNVPAKPAAK